MADLKDHLQDIVKNIGALSIETVKISGTVDSTLIEAVGADNTVVVYGETATAIPELIGNFGLPNLSKLNAILNLSEYREDAVIRLTTATRDGETVPSGLHFETKAGDFENDYRFMTQSLVNEQIKTLKFKGANWNVEFTPSVSSINRLKSQAAVNSEETTFVIKTDAKKNLKIFFGDHSSHAGNFIFETGISGTLTKGWSWPVAAVVAILNLAGDKTFRISDEGAAQITVDTGLAVYNFILPAQSR